MQQTDKTSYMMDYLSPVLASNQNETAAKLLRVLFSSEINNARSSAENDLFRSSPTVTALTSELTGELKNALILFKNESQSKEELISNLKSVLVNFKIAVNENKSLTFDEARALLAAAEFKSNSITEVVNMAIGLDTNIGGRTEGWFSNLIQAVVTAVVAAVVVVAVVVTGGAALGLLATGFSFATAITVGAVVGGVYGGVVGYDNANRGNYFTGFNPGNIGGGFLDWKPCYQNSIGWACI